MELGNIHRVKQTSKFIKQFKNNNYKKELFLALAASCICIYASSFDAKKAKPIVTDKIEQSLAKEFKNPGQVEGSENKHNTIQASLNVEGQQVNAFFGNNGECICFTTLITKENLPLKLRLGLIKNLANIGISAILETGSEEGTSYYFQGVDAKSVKFWKRTANGNVEFIQKL